jgi:glycosyltransferase involved in cell wall biosynthesis
MKLLHVITTLDVGGAEMHLLSQVRGQTARGHEVRVAYLKGHGTLERDFESAGAGWVGSVAGLVPLKLREHLAWCDVVHSHLLKADVATALSATLFGKRKRLLSGKHNDEQVLKRPLVSRIHGVVGSLPVRTIVLSDHVGRFIERYGRIDARRMSRVYYGLDPAPFEAAVGAATADKQSLRASFGFAPDDVVFTCVARFAPQKAHDVLLRAFHAAHAERLELRLLLVGDDPFGDGRERAQALADELGLADAVVFAGIRRDVPAILAASDVFVMSSLWEGLGLVFLEAMATGLPVLASDVSAVPEVVVDGETGVLVPPADAAALSAGFTRLAADPALRQALGESGRARVAEVFGIERMVDETLAIYAEVVAGDPA